MARGVLIPEHYLVEVNGLGLCAPVPVDAEAWLGVDEGHTVAARAVLGIAHRAAVGAAGAAIEPDINAAGRIVRRQQSHVDGGPGLTGHVVGDADLRALDPGRRGAGVASRNLRKEAHAVAERSRLDFEKRARAAGFAVHEGVLLDLVDYRAAWLATRHGHVARPVVRDLEGEAVPHGLAELHDLAGTGLAVGFDLDLRPLARRHAIGLRLHLRRARALGVADIPLR